MVQRIEVIDLKRTWNMISIGSMWLLLTGALISTQTVKNLAKATAMV